MVINSGNVQLLSEAAGNAVVLDVKGEGSFFGEISMMLQSSMTASVRAKTDVLAACVPHEAIINCMEEDVALRTDLWQWCSRHIGETLLRKEDTFKEWRNIRINMFLKGWRFAEMPDHESSDLHLIILVNGECRINEPQLQAITAIHKHVGPKICWLQNMRCKFSHGAMVLLPPLAMDDTWEEEVKNWMQGKNIVEEEPEPPP